MIKIKLCGLSRLEDIEIANELMPEYVGFVFAQESKRYVTPDRAAELKKLLRKEILAVGVFVNARIETVAELANQNIIDVIQLHGTEDADYLLQLRTLTIKPIIKAIQVRRPEDLTAVNEVRSDYVLIDSGKGTGKAFDWGWLKDVRREYFLAGGLTPKNVGYAIERLHPFAVDVSSGIETEGSKDAAKMREFVLAVRGDVK